METVKKYLPMAIVAVGVVYLVAKFAPSLMAPKASN